MVESARYLTLRILHPKSEHKNDTVSAIGNISKVARNFEGLIEIGAWIDGDSERIISISLWESKELAEKATKEMHAMFADIPWNDWEREPAENFLKLNRVV